MLGLSVASEPASVSVSAPQRRFSSARCFNASTARFRYSVEANGSSRPFARLQRGGVTDSPRQGQRSRPTSSPLGMRSARPAGFGLPASLVWGADPHPSPAARLLSHRIDPLACRHSPPGFRPRDQSARLAGGPIGLPCETPANLSLPVTAIGENTRHGSSFQARLVPLGSLFREPLGTISRMPRNRFAVKKKPVCNKVFPQFIFLLLSTTCETRPEDFLWKKQQSRLMFRGLGFGTGRELENHSGVGSGPDVSG
jgi:hypothetical protein